MYFDTRPHLLVMFRRCLQSLPLIVLECKEISRSRAQNFNPEAILSGIKSEPLLWFRLLSRCPSRYRTYLEVGRQFTVQPWTDQKLRVTLILEHNDSCFGVGRIHSERRFLPALLDES